MFTIIIFEYIINLFSSYDIPSIYHYHFYQVDRTRYIQPFAMFPTIAYSRNCLTIWLFYPDYTLQYYKYYRYLNRYIVVLS